MNYTSVLPSNHFRTHKRTKREKEDPHQAKGTRERATQGQAYVHRRSSLCPLPVKLVSIVSQARVHCQSSLCPPASSHRTHTQRKKERRPIPQAEQGKGTPSTHPSSSPIHPLSSSFANPSFVLKVLRWPTSIDPSLVLTNPSLILTDPPPLTHLPPFFSLKTHLLSFPSRSRILWGSYSVFLFCLHDLVEVVTLICSWLQLICFCWDLLVLR